MLAPLLWSSSLALLMPIAATAVQANAAPNAPVIACDAELPADADADSRRIACTIPTEFNEDVSLAELFGRLLRRHDMAAWLSTDALNPRDALAKAGKRIGNPRGWTTEEHEAGVRVRYIAGPDAAPVALAGADLRFEPFGIVDAYIPNVPTLATDRERRLLKARDLALTAPGLFTCTQAAPNLVVTEFKGDDGVPRILVAVMSAWTDDVGPLGGYHLVRLDTDATQIIDVFSQTKGCPTGGSRRQLAKAEALMVSHLTSTTRPCSTSS